MAILHNINTTTYKPDFPAYQECLEDYVRHHGRKQKGGGDATQQTASVMTKVLTAKVSDR